MDTKCLLFYLATTTLQISLLLNLHFNRLCRVFTEHCIPIFKLENLSLVQLLESLQCQRQRQLLVGCTKSKI